MQRVHLTGESECCLPLAAVKSDILLKDIDNFQQTNILLLYHLKLINVVLL